MSARLNPYISFGDTAREAMETYRDIFGGELTISTFGESGAQPADGVMHAQLETPLGFTLMASDTPEGVTHTPGSSVSISLSGDPESGADLRGYFERLGVGGQVAMPLEKQMWGDEFGMVVDRFGIHWMVNIAGAPAEG